MGHITQIRGYCMAGLKDITCRQYQMPRVKGTVCLLHQKTVDRVTVLTAGPHYGQLHK
jgi:hypothetical protein